MTSILFGLFLAAPFQGSGHGFWSLAEALWRAPDAPACTVAIERHSHANVAPAMAENGSFAYALACEPASADRSACRNVVRVAAPAAVRSLASLAGLAQLAVQPQDADEDADDDLDEGEADDEPAGRGAWLGVQAGPVPEALATHLKRKGGALIVNVADDSPAAQAGIEQYDVLLELGGKVVDEASEPLRDVVAEFEPGQQINAKIIRAGVEQAVQITVGQRPRRMGRVKYKYEAQDAPETRVETFAPRMWTLDKDGRLTQPDSQSLLKLRGLIPQIHGGNGQNTITEKGNVVIMRSDDDGAKLEIKQVNKGKITVTRTDKNGVATTGEYEDMKALKAADAEAYQLMKNHQVRSLYGGDAWGVWSFGGDRDDEIDAQEQIDRAMRQAEEAMQQSKSARRLGRSGAFWMNRDDLTTPTRTGLRFETMPDGSIKVITRRRGDEMVHTFKNADELKREKPAWHGRYLNMMDENNSPDDAEQENESDE